MKYLNDEGYNVFWEIDCINNKIIGKDIDTHKKLCEITSEELDATPMTKEKYYELAKRKLDASR